MDSSKLFFKIEQLPQAIQKQLIENIEYLFAKYSSKKNKPGHPKKKYDFSDLIGKLKWKGNALVAQKHLRNEWE